MSIETGPQDAVLAALDELLKGRASPEERTRQLFRLTQTQTSITDPALAEILPACAIPRRLTAPVIGVLRNAPTSGPAVEENERLLECLGEFTFVLRRKDGDLIYHDSTRRLLLADWRAGVYEGFEELNARLAAFYASRHDDVLDLEGSLQRVAGVIRAANPERLAQLATLLDARRVAVLLEGLYHENLRGTQAAFRFFQRHFERLEAEGRLRTCHTLLAAAHEHLHNPDVGESGEQWQRWLRYYDARLAYRGRQLDEAGQILRELLDESPDDNRLVLWARSELGSLLQESWRLTEARGLFEQGLALALETREDPWNLPLDHARLAGLYWSLQDLEAAIGLYRQAIRYADEAANEVVAIHLHLSLSTLLLEAGQWQEALEVALEGMHRAWSSSRQHPGVMSTLSRRLMALFTPRLPRLLDTVFCQALELMSGVHDPLELLELASEYADRLRSSGQLDRAEALFGILRGNPLRGELENEPWTGFAEALRNAAIDWHPAPESRHPEWATDLVFRQAVLREWQGEDQQAIELYGEVLQAQTRRPGQRFNIAGAHTNRGYRHGHLGHWESGEKDLKDAVRLWQEMGNDRLAQYSRVLLADVVRRQGRLDEAEKLLRRVSGALAPADAIYRAREHITWGHLSMERGQLSKARKHYQDGLHLRLRAGDPRASAACLLHLADVDGRQGQWEAAAAHAREAAVQWERLKPAGPRGPKQSEADRANAIGVALSVVGSDPQVDLVNARDRFRAAAELEPDNVCYLLNRSHVCAELGEWKEAADAVEAVIQVGIEGWAPPILHERLCAYRLKEGDDLRAAGDRDGALQAYEDAGRALDRVPLDSFVPRSRFMSALTSLGDGLLELGQAEQAEDRYRAGLAVAEDDRSLQAKLHLRLGLAGADRHALTEAAERFHQSLELFLRAETSDPAGSLVDETLALVTTPPRYRAVRAALQAFSDALPSTDEPRRRAAVTARLRLSRKAYFSSGAAGWNWESAAPATGDHPLFVRPLAVETHRSYLPIGGEDEHPLLADYLPDMRERVRQQTGIPIPSIRVRCNDVDYLRDVAVVLTDELPCLLIQLNKAATGDTDPYRYLTGRLETFICERLDAFLGIQETRDLLEAWQHQSDDDRRELLARALADPDSLSTLVRVLRALLSEGVPISSLEVILRVFADRGEHAEVTPTVETIRRELQDQLPGNDGSSHPIRLSTAIERVVLTAVQRREGKAYLALPPAQVQRLLSAVRGALDDETFPRSVVVTTSPGLRPYVRRMLQVEFAQVPVLAADELVPALQARAGTTVDLAGGETE